VLADALGAAGGAPALAHEADEARLPVAQRRRGLAQHDGLGAGAAHPAEHGAVGADQRLGARLGRGRPLAAHHGGEGERFTLLP
jgi:hypothetical protein